MMQMVSAERGGLAQQVLELGEIRNCVAREPLQSE
jgi:hypothetical protein